MTFPATILCDLKANSPGILLQDMVGVFRWLNDEEVVDVQYLQVRNKGLENFHTQVGFTLRLHSHSGYMRTSLGY